MKLNKLHNNTISGQVGWWNEKYITDLFHHSFQNKTISRDFIENVMKNREFLSLFNSANSISELGSGTGELSYYLYKKFGYSSVRGFEVTQTAVDIANKLYGSEVISFLKIETSDNLSGYGKTDFLICSNTLEHFKDPCAIIDKAFHLSDVIVVIVPYNQKCIDIYESEGGPGHVYSFDEYTFKDKYEVAGYFVFRSGGWQTSSQGEDPLQIAYILKK